MHHSTTWPLPSWPMAYESELLMGWYIVNLLPLLEMREKLQSPAGKATGLNRMVPVLPHAAVQLSVAPTRPPIEVLDFISASSS